MKITQNGTHTEILFKLFKNSEGDLIQISDFLKIGYIFKCFSF